MNLARIFSATARLERAQRRHVQSAHQISYPVPHEPKRGGWLGYAVLVIVAVSAFVYGNFFHDAPAQSVCAVVARNFK